MITPHLTEEEYSATLEACAGDLLWQAEIEQPPVDAFLVASRLKLLVSEDPTLEARACYSRIGGARPSDAYTGLILLSNEARPERRQWAVAHEIGESAAYRVFNRLGVNPTDAAPGARETVANGLAGRLLLPRDWFLEDARTCDWDLIELKRCYRTASHELIARRVLELSPSPAIVTVIDQGATTWRRANFRAVDRGLSPSEKPPWQKCHADAVATESTRVDYPLTRVRCWPVHEPGWQREILLTELDETA
ncbi:MAG: ImmA/IrrE family metallo-endopeptidase [Planctomycetota bacterium]